MSLPPNIIRVKRKRVEEAPVTFLHIDQRFKRHRGNGDGNWVYQRRGSTAAAQQQQEQLPSPHLHTDAEVSVSLPAAKDVVDNANNVGGKRKAVEDVGPKTTEPRRFRVSKSVLSATVRAGAISRTTLFVERTRRKKLAPRLRRSMPALAAVRNGDVAAAAAVEGTVNETARLKRPGVAKRISKGMSGGTWSSESSTSDAEPRTALGGAERSSSNNNNNNPLPDFMAERATGDMDKIAADMNDWVLRELRAGLASREEEPVRRQHLDSSKPDAAGVGTKRTGPVRFRPRAPAKRFHERHPEVSLPPSGLGSADAEGDLSMTDASEEEEEGEGDDDGDWVIEEYVRVPVHSVTSAMASWNVGYLVLDGEEENLLFFGAHKEKDDDWEEDEEDENAEGHYTADYPEDEVDSEDEFDRNAYCFRTGNASDEEEFDENDLYGDDEVGSEGSDEDEDDDVRMTRMLEQMKRLRTSQGTLKDV